MKGLQSAYIAALFDTFGTKSLPLNKRLGPPRTEIQTLVERPKFFPIKYSEFDKSALIIYLMNFCLHLSRGVWGLTSRLDRPCVKRPLVLLKFCQLQNIVTIKLPSNSFGIQTIKINPSMLILNTITFEMHVNQARLNFYISIQKTSLLIYSPSHYPEIHSTNFANHLACAVSLRTGGVREIYMFSEE